MKPVVYTEAELVQASEEIARGQSRAQTPSDRALVRDCDENLVRICVAQGIDITRVRLQSSRQVVAGLRGKWLP